MEQDELDNLGENLGVCYKVLDNLTDGKKTYRAQIVLTNNSNIDLKNEDWAIYFCHIRMLEPSHLPHSISYEIHDTGMKFTHVNGCLFKLSPTKRFKPLKKGDSLTLKFRAQYYSIARSDLMPNWYFLYPKLRPVLIQSTVGEEMSFVEPFDEPSSWKRFDYELADGSSRFDHYNPYNLQERFDRQHCTEPESIQYSVIPTPYRMKVDSTTILTINSEDWSIHAEDSLQNEAMILSKALDVTINDSKEKKYKISLKLVTNLKIDGKDACNDSYRLEIKQGDGITIEATASSGIFYGVNTLLSLTKDNTVPVCKIEDKPRYSYRGMHMDVSRNFHGKESIMKLLDVMAMYKMNKFHFHLTDDEGWRLEIPGLEELTQVGARRGHVNKSDLSSLLPLLGSGPDFSTSGSGYYTVDEYREILRYAKERYIEVIPEIDMPGHSHAAIKSMKARYQKYIGLKDKKKAEEYLLSDLDHNTTLGSHSVQMFSENAMNPGVESTYKFVEKVALELKEMHKDIMPLEIFHFGGDEVPYEAWEGSPACMSLVDSEEVKSSEDLMEYFVKRVADVMAKCNLDVGAWQDGIIPDETDLIPIARHNFKSKNVYVYAWQNVWESGLSGCAYRLANKGYKVIMSQGTHLYFDHPYEPDPEERGLYWACRFCDSQKTFTFMPDNIYANADVKLTGEGLSKDYISRHKDDHDDLQQPQNVVGIQAQLWTELVRTSDQMDSMIFPRLLCVAERAWHKADWELVTDKAKLKEEQHLDWSKFATLLGTKELARLDEKLVCYHLPPPGASFSLSDCKIRLNCAYPGLPLYYSIDNGTTWIQYKDDIDLILDNDLLLCTKSADGKRMSRIVKMKRPSKD
ncbi:hypothetical protein ACF0H5_013871 [Mactra antiquata]